MKIKFCRNQMGARDSNFMFKYQFWTIRDRPTDTQPKSINSD